MLQFLHQIFNLFALWSSIAVCVNNGDAHRCLSVCLSVCLCRRWRIGNWWQRSTTVPISILRPTHHGRYLLAWIRSFQVSTHYQLQRIQEYSVSVVSQVVFNNPSSDLAITKYGPLQTLRNLGLWPGLTVSLCNNTFEPTVIFRCFCIHVIKSLRPLCTVFHIALDYVVSNS